MKKVLPSSVSEKIIVRWRVVGSATTSAGVTPIWSCRSAGSSSRACSTAVSSENPDTASVASRTSGFGSPCGPVSTASVRTA